MLSARWVIDPPTVDGISHVKGGRREGHYSAGTTICITYLYIFVYNSVNYLYIRRKLVNESSVGSLVFLESIPRMR